MDIPKSIKIGVHKYKIQPTTRHEGEDIFGEVRIREGVIKINPDLSPTMQAETLFHEIVHVILDNCNYKEESSNEQLVQIIAKGIYQVLHDNRLLAKE